MRVDVYVFAIFRQAGPVQLVWMRACVNIDKARPQHWDQRSLLFIKVRKSLNVPC